MASGAVPRPEYFVVMYNSDRERPLSLIEIGWLMLMDVDRTWLS